MSYFPFGPRVPFSSTLFAACYCIYFSIHPSPPNAATGLIVCNISVYIVLRFQGGPHVSAGKWLLALMPKGENITARRGKKVSVNSFLLPATDFTLLGGDAYVRTRCVRVRSIDLHKAQGLCSVLKRWKFSTDGHVATTVWRMYLGGVLAESSLVLHVVYGCLDPALSLMSRHWITPHTFSYRGSSLFLSRFSPTPDTSARTTLDVCTMVNIVRTPCLERGARKYFVDVLITLVARHLSFMPQTSPQTKQLE